MDEAAADWQLLQQAAAWAAAGGGHGPGGEGARAVLRDLSVDAIQLLCRRLVTAEAPAAVCGGVLRWAVRPRLEQLASTAPQALVECLQMAGEGRVGGVTINRWH